MLSRRESLIDGTPVMITTTLHSILSPQSVVAQTYELQNVNYRYVFYEPFNKKKSNKNRSHDDPICKSTNVVYDLECNLGGLVYVVKKWRVEHTHVTYIHQKNKKISEKKKRDEIIFA